MLVLRELWTRPVFRLGSGPQPWEGGSQTPVPTPAQPRPCTLSRQELSGGEPPGQRSPDGGRGAGALLPRPEHGPLRGHLEHAGPEGKWASRILGMSCGSCQGIPRPPSACGAPASRPAGGPRQVLPLCRSPPQTWTSSCCPLRLTMPRTYTSSGSRRAAPTGRAHPGPTWVSPSPWAPPGST